MKRQPLRKLAILSASPLLVFLAMSCWNVSPLLAQSAERQVLRIGSQGTQVSDLQAVLKLLGYYGGAVNGLYDERTVISVFLFQQAANLNPNGIVDRATWDRLFPTATNPPSNSAPSFPSPTATQPRPAPAPTSTAPRPASTTRPTLRSGMEGAAVRELQERLRALGFAIGSIDGVFGDATLRAVIAAQNKFNIAPDGVVGPSTWRVLLGR